MKKKNKQNKENKKDIESMIRVNHAGEYGARRIYAGQLELPEAMAEAAQMVALASEKPSALLCYEREPGGCHRTLLLKAAAPDVEVVDLFA